MFGIRYDTWKSICNMYFSLPAGSQKSYLQWFPFTKLSKNDQDTIMSEYFYNKYINSSSLIVFPSVMQKSDNFIQKGDGSFRDSSLVSPLLFLMLQAVGKKFMSSTIRIDLLIFQFTMQAIISICVRITNRTMMIFSKN